MALIPTLEAPDILIIVAGLMLEINFYSSRRGFGRLLAPGQRPEFLAKRGEGCFKYCWGRRLITLARKQNSELLQMQWVSAIKQAVGEEVPEGRWRKMGEESKLAGSVIADRERRGIARGADRVKNERTTLQCRAQQGSGLALRRGITLPAAHLDTCCIRIFDIFRKCRHKAEETIVVAG